MIGDERRRCLGDLYGLSSETCGFLKTEASEDEDCKMED